jgi:hypothetical protein
MKALVTMVQESFQHFILNSNIDSIQIYSTNVLIIYYKHCYVKVLMTYIINANFDVKT